MATRHRVGAEVGGGFLHSDDCHLRENHGNHGRFGRSTQKSKDKLKEASAGLSDARGALLPLKHKSDRGRAQFEEIDREYDSVKRTARGEVCHAYCHHGHWRWGGCKDAWQHYRPDNC
jgi:hypothetical protein